MDALSEMKTKAESTKNFMSYILMKFYLLLTILISLKYTMKPILIYLRPVLGD
jgi:hypothetical protein